MKEVQFFFPHQCTCKGPKGSEIISYLCKSIQLIILRARFKPRYDLRVHALNHFLLCCSSFMENEIQVSVQSFSTGQNLKVEYRSERKGLKSIQISTLLIPFLCSLYQGHDQKDFTEENEEHLAEGWLQMGWTVEERTVTSVENESCILVSKNGGKSTLCFK